MGQNIFATKDIYKVGIFTFEHK